MRRLVGLVVLAATLVVVPTPAHAGEVPSNSSTVTLITGDVAQVSTYPDGRQAVNLRPGPATGHGTFQTVQFGTHTYVYPDQVLPYVQRGLLDERLFDVTTLAAQGYGDLPLILG
jgi:hypothetical protein